MIANNSVVGLVVRISAFQADGPGSIPGQRKMYYFLARFAVLIQRKMCYQVPLAQWLERRSYEPDVAGSNPAWNILIRAISLGCLHRLT